MFRTMALLNQLQGMQKYAVIKLWASWEPNPAAERSNTRLPNGKSRASASTFSAENFLMH